ncbi:MAG: 30S ribosomal protein S6 [Ignavibacteriales bacterium]|nr:30S ribosomal protein S6 [Ignavibacteriales bacterium]
MALQPKLYETAFIVNAALEDSQIEGVIEKVKDSISKNGGSVRDLAKWGRKRFAYPIKKKNNGFYVVAEYTGPGDLVAKLERHYQLDESILRYLIVAVDPDVGTGRIKPSDLVGAKEGSSPEAAAVPAKSGGAA